MKIELTEQQLKNLKAFLSRVQLQGNEVGAFQEVLQALQMKVPEELDED